MADWSEAALLPARQRPAQPAVQQRVQRLGGGGVVAGEETDEGLDAGPGGGGTAAEVVLQQLGYQVLSVQFRSCQLSGGQSPGVNIMLKLIFS